MKLTAKSSGGCDRIRTGTEALRGAVCAAVLLAVDPVSAQDAALGDSSALEQIIVTARRTEENIQDTPVAVTALSSAALEERAVENISEIAPYVPSLRFDPAAAISGSSNSATVFIRGVGQTDFNLTIDPGVGIYLDGVYISRSVGALLDTADVERIEVLRGPQGTLFGKNTIGGAIAITSRRPADRPEFGAEVATGSLDRADVRLTASAPLTDTWRAHFTGAMFTRDGYVDRLWDGEESSDRDSLSGRLVSESTPSTDVTLTLALDGSRAREATVGATALRIHEVNPSPATIPVHFPTISNLLLNGAQCAPPNPNRLSDPACYNEQWLTGDPRETFERLHPGQIVDPVAHAIELLARLLVARLRDRGDELLLARGERPHVLEPAVDRRRVTVRRHERLQCLHETPGRRVDHRLETRMNVGLRPAAGLPHLAHRHGLGAVDLVWGRQPVGSGAERVCGSRPVPKHVLAPVLGADAAIKAGVDACRHAALAGEEGVADAG